MEQEFCMNRLNQFEMFVSSLIHEKNVENGLLQKENNVVLNGKHC